MNKETLDILNELTKKPITELALSYMELVTDNMVKDKEIDRLNNIINYIWQVFENGSFEDGCDCIKIYDYLKELKEGDKE